MRRTLHLRSIGTASDPLLGDRAPLLVVGKSKPAPLISKRKQRYAACVIFIALVVTVILLIYNVAVAASNSPANPSPSPSPPYPPYDPSPFSPKGPSAIPKNGTDPTNPSNYPLSCGVIRVPGSHSYSCIGCTKNQTQNPCNPHYTCEEGAQCVAKPGIESCMDDGTDRYPCVGCKKGSVTESFCTQGGLAYKCASNGTMCEARCSALTHERDPKVNTEYKCGCNTDNKTNTDYNPCYHTHHCNQGKVCALKCAFRTQDGASSQYNCQSCTGGGGDNPCAEGFMCTGSACAIQCNSSLLPDFGNYICENYNITTNPCKTSHKYVNGHCMYNSCAGPDASGCSNCHPLTNPCGAPGTKCLMRGMSSICTTDCNQPHSGAFSSAFDCACTKDYDVRDINTEGSEGNTTEGNPTVGYASINSVGDSLMIGVDTLNPCPEGFRCSKGLKCVARDGPGGESVGRDYSDVCLADTETRFVNYAWWDPVYTLTDCEDGSRDCATGDSVKTWGCKCHDLNNLLDPATGCSPFLQHTQFGRNLLFDFAASGSSSGKRGILSTDLYPPSWNSSDTEGSLRQHRREQEEGCEMVLTFNRSIAGSRMSRVDTATWDDKDQQANCLRVQSRKLPAQYLYTTKALTQLLRERLKTFSNTTSVEKEHVRKKRLVDYGDLVGSPDTLRSKQSYDAFRAKIFEKQVSDPVRKMIKMQGFNQNMWGFEQLPLTLYEGVAKYVKNQHLVSCGELPGTLHVAQSNKPTAAPYSQLFHAYLGRLDKKTLYCPNEGCCGETLNGTLRRDLPCCKTKTKSCLPETKVWGVFIKKHKLKFIEDKEGVGDNEKKEAINQPWTALDAMFHKMNVGLPFDFHVTSSNWYKQICLWNGNAAAPIGTPNILDPPLSTTKDGTKGSLCLDCRLNSETDGECRANTCSGSSNVFERSRGQCGLQPNPDSCTCDYPLDNPVLEDANGKYQLHWSSWEANSVQDSEGDTSNAQCGKPVKCYENGLDPKTQQPVFSQYIKPTLGFQDKTGNLDALCQCLNANFYTAGSSQYNFCESKSEECRTIRGLGKDDCKVDKYLKTLAPKHGPHNYQALDIQCDCSEGYHDGIVCMNATCFASGTIQAATKTFKANGDEVCKCKNQSTVDKLDTDNTPFKLITKYYGPSCNKKKVCYDWISGEGTTVRSTQLNSKVIDEKDVYTCTCGKSSNMITAGDSCESYYSCHNGTLVDRGASAPQPLCVCDSYPDKLANWSSIQTHVENFRTKFENFHNNESNVTNTYNMRIAMRALLPGYFTGYQCAANYVHCVFGDVGIGPTQCGHDAKADEKCCVCNAHYTGPYCDTPCGFMCSPGSESKQGGEWVAYVDQDIPYGSCASSGFRIFNNNETYNGAGARNEIFGKTLMMMRNQITPQPMCNMKGGMADPWVDLFEPACANNGHPFYQGPDKIFYDGIRRKNNDGVSTAGGDDGLGSVIRAFQINAPRPNYTFPPEWNKILALEKKYVSLPGKVILQNLLDFAWPIRTQSVAKTPDDNTTNPDDNMRPDANRTITHAYRLRFFSRLQRVVTDANGHGFDFEYLPPWFKSNTPGTGPLDKCSYPKAFPKSSFNDGMWGVSLVRMAFAVDDDSPYDEVFDYKVKFTYIEEDSVHKGKPRGIIAYNWQDPTSEFTGINGLTDSDDTFTVACNMDAFDEETSSDYCPRSWRKNGDLYNDLPNGDSNCGRTSHGNNAIYQDAAMLYMGANAQQFSEDDLRKFTKKFGELFISTATGWDAQRMVDTAGGMMNVPGFKDPDWVGTMKAFMIKTTKGKLGAYTGPVDIWGGFRPPGDNYLRHSDRTVRKYFYNNMLSKIKMTYMGFTEWDGIGPNDTYGCAGSKVLNAAGKEVNMRDWWTMDPATGVHYIWAKCDNDGDDDHEEDGKMWFKLEREQYFM